MLNLEGGESRGNRSEISFPPVLCLQVFRSAAGDKKSDLDSELQHRGWLPKKKLGFHKSFYEFNLFFSIFQMRRLADDCNGGKGVVACFIFNQFWVLLQLQLATAVLLHLRRSHTLGLSD